VAIGDAHGYEPLGRCAAERESIVNTIQSTNLTDELRQLLGPDRVLDAHSDLAVYECDAFVIEKHCPNVAVFPKTTAEVAAIVKLCNASATPFVPRGAGTSLAGGGLPVGGGVMVVLTRMREILEVNLFLHFLSAGFEYSYLVAGRPKLMI